jgi:hypothetical protein
MVRAAKLCPMGLTVSTLWGLGTMQALRFAHGVFNETPDTEFPLNAVVALNPLFLWLTKTPSPLPLTPFNTLFNVMFRVSCAMCVPSCNWSKRKTKRSSSSKTPVPASKSAVGVA